MISLCLNWCRLIAARNHFIESLTVQLDFEINPLSPVFITFSFCTEFHWNKASLYAAANAAVSWATDESKQATPHDAVSISVGFRGLARLNNKTGESRKFALEGRIERGNLLADFSFRVNKEVHRSHMSAHENRRRVSYFNRLNSKVSGE